ncbi:MAG: hypothetical protein H7Y09_04425, partial [Chitinophagaceae bacterium]|nr:hypothetical protein [Anaerolineae bacterium]
MVKIDQDIVSIADILDALETMLAASDNLRFTNRLRTLVLVDLFLSDPSLPKLEDAREFAVFDILTTIIRENYQRTRQIFGLTPVLQTASWVEAKQAITQETQKNSTDLLSWSCLYYCYIRVDLNISAVSFGEVVGIVERSVRRYRRKGLFRLYHALVSQEWEIRARQRVRRLRLQLPNIAPSLLLCREGGFEKIQKLLAEDFAFKLFISGAAGIGKSALVEAYIRAYIEGELPEAPQIDVLIWVDSPKGA